MSNATESFCAELHRARDLCAKLSEYLDDHMGAEPDSINWGNLGDAARITKLLAEIVDDFAIGATAANNQRKE